MRCLTDWRRRGRGICAGAVALATAQVVGCSLDPQQVFDQLAGFARDFALQVLAAYLV